MEKRPFLFLLIAVLVTLLLPAFSTAQRGGGEPPPEEEFRGEPQEEKLEPLPGEVEEEPRRGGRGREREEREERRREPVHDLSVRILSLSGEGPGDGEMRVGLRVDSAGEAGLEGVAVRLTIGRRTVAPDITLHPAPRRGAEGEAFFPAPGAGRHTLTVTVDPDNRIAESNERNNSASRAFTVREAARDGAGRAEGRGPRTQPDLTVKFLGVKTAARGGKIIASARVSCTGGPLETAVRLLLGRDPIAPDRFVELRSGGSETVRFEFPEEEAASRTLTVLVDPENDIHESNERNNSDRKELRAAEVSLADPPEERIPSPRGAFGAKVARLKGAGPPRPGDRPAGPGDRPFRSIGGIASSPPLETMADTIPDKPNIVCQVDSLQGMHFFNGKTIPVRVTNKGIKGVTSKSLVGIREHGVYMVGANVWEATATVGPLAPGGTATVQVPWKKGLTLTTYVADADADGKVDEGGGAREQDNSSAPFRLAAMIKGIVLEPPALSLDNPDGSAYFRGGLMEITWMAKGSARGAALQVGLYKGGSKVVSIPHSGGPPPDPTGTYKDWTSWDIPLNFTKGTYTLKIATPDGQTSDTSPPFEITDGAIDITKPDSSSSWATGGTYTVSWKADIYKWKDHTAQYKLFGKSKAATLSLLSKGGGPAVSYTLALIDDFRNGGYSWTIPPSTGAGPYVMKITSNDGKFYGESDLFSIVAKAGSPVPAFTVLEPDKSDSWPTKSTQTIEWDILPAQEKQYKIDYGQLSKKVNLSLTDPSGAHVRGIASGVDFKSTFTTKETEWKIPGDLKQGQYRVKVETSDKKFYGLGEPFKVFTMLPPVKIAGQKPGKTAQAVTMAEAAGGGKLYDVSNPPPALTPMKLDIAVKSLIPKKSIVLGGGTSGKYGWLSKLDIVVEVTSDRPFIFGDVENPGSQNPATAYATATPEVTIVAIAAEKAWVGDPPYTENIKGDNYVNWQDPSGSFPYRKVYGPGPLLTAPKGPFPKGKSTLTVSVEDVGVFSKLSVVGQVKVLEEYYVGITKKKRLVWGKCIKHFNPLLGVVFNLKIKGPLYTKGYKTPGATGYKRFTSTPATKWIDTTLTVKQLGYVPSWSGPETYSQGQCDEPYEKTLIGGS